MFDFPSNWTISPLEDCMAAIIDYRGVTPEKSSFGIPLVTAKIVKGGRLLEFNEYIAEETYDIRMQRGFPEPGDVVMTTEAPLGEIAQLDDRKVALGQRIITLRGQPDILDNTFLKFLMLSDFVQDQLKGRATGTTVLGIRQRELRTIRLVLPPLNEQKKIARILGALDDKIELNRRMNHTLEEMARALFKSWFVDFDPVTAKAEGRVPFGMNAETATLFPSGFQDSELGSIPKGWNAGNLKQIVKVNPETLKNDYQHKEIKYIDISSVDVGNLLSTTTTEIQNAPSRAKRLVKHGDTIWSCVRPNRKSYLFIQHPSPNIVVSTGFAVLSPKIPSDSFVYLWVTTDDFVDYLTANAEGSAYPAVKPESFERASVLIPPDDVLMAFEKLVKPFFELRHQNASQSQTLAAIRDALLPKLLSGEVRVKVDGNN